MIVVFDASVLVFLFAADASPPIDQATGESVTYCAERVTYLIAELQRAKAKIVIPAPALAEVLVYGGTAAPGWLRVLSTSRHIRITPFDQLAAIEFAEMERVRRGARPPEVSRAKAKFDQQIVAIARLEGADVIFSDDAHIRSLAPEPMIVRGVADLELAPAGRQAELIFDADVNEAPSDDQ